jgi:membrane fusion protein (multidrug efflux system)
MTLVVLAVLVAAIAYGVYYYLVARFYEDTDDAYVNGNVVQITPQVTGTVIAVNADDTQTVKAGDPLVVLDAADARVALQQAEANLAQTVRHVRGLFADDNQYHAQVAEREADLSRGLCHVDWAMTQTDGGCVFAQTVDGFWVSSVKRCHESKR